jgi:hypothetical protein
MFLEGSGVPWFLTGISEEKSTVPWIPQNPTDSESSVRGQYLVTPRDVRLSQLDAQIDRTRLVCLVQWVQGVSARSSVSRPVNERLREFYATRHLDEAKVMLTELQDHCVKRSIPFEIQARPHDQELVRQDPSPGLQRPHRRSQRTGADYRGLSQVGRSATCYSSWARHHGDDQPFDRGTTVIHSDGMTGGVTRRIHVSSSMVPPRIGSEACRNCPTSRGFVACSTITQLAR